MGSLFRRLFYAISYLGSPPWDTNISPPELLNFIQTHPAGRALDLGCGTGKNLATLAEHGWQTTGVDFSRKAVRLARSRLTACGFPAKILFGDVSRKPGVVGKFDLILDIGCYHDLSPANRKGYQNNIKEWLASGGSFLIYAHCLSEDRLRATGISQEDIDAFSIFLRVEDIVYTTDRWERKTVWMTFINSG
jgi:cyclopropane fatty-acyl-phospholipid synthase-like methyltransferase